MKKHSTIGKIEKKGRNSAKMVILMVGICILLGVVVYMVYIKNKPKIIVNNLFTELKAGNKEKINNYLDYKQLIYSLDETLAAEDNEQVLNIEKSLFNSIDWSIKNTEIDGENITAIVEVVNKDFVKVITNWMKKIINEKTKGIEITQELSLQKLQETLEQTQEKKTVNKKITFKHENGKWRVEVDESFRDLVYPGIDSVITVLNQNNTIKVGDSYKRYKCRRGYQVWNKK